MIQIAPAVRISEDGGQEGRHLAPRSPKRVKRYKHYHTTEELAAKGYQVSFDELSLETESPRDRKGSRENAEKIFSN